MNPLQRPVPPDAVMVILRELEQHRVFKEGGRDRILARYKPGMTTTEEFVDLAERELEPLPINGLRADLTPWAHINGR